MKQQVVIRAERLQLNVGLHTDVSLGRRKTLNPRLTLVTVAPVIKAHAIQITVDDDLTTE